LKELNKVIMGFAFEDHVFEIGCKGLECFFKTLGEEGHRTSMPPSLQGLSLQSICNATDELPSMSQKTAKLSDAIGPVMTDGVLTF